MNTTNIRQLLGLAFILAAGLSLLPEPSKAQIVNGTFEQIVEGTSNGQTNSHSGEPMGWKVPEVAADDGWAAMVGVSADTGIQGAFIYRQSDTAPQTFGNLMQTIDVDALRGQRFRLEAQVDLLEPGGATLQMWARVDRPDGARGFFDNMGDRPVRESGGRRVVIEGEVATDAVSMSLGFLIQGGAGRAFVTGVELTPLGPVGLGARPAAELTDRALDNVATFVRLVGLVRYFHPSDESVNADWDTFRIAGIDAVEPAPSDEALAATLRDLFEPIAPTVQVWAGDRANAPAPIGLPASPEITMIRHRGLGAPLFEMPMSQSIYSSERLREKRTTDEGTTRAGSAADDDLPQPPFESIIELGAGVSARIPHVLAVDETGTLPRPLGTQAQPGRPPGWAPDWRDRSFRLAAVGAAWNVLEHFYPYWDVLDVDWHEVLRKRLAHAAISDGPEDLGDVLELLVADAQDGHGNLMRAQAVKGFLPARLEWLGNEPVVSVTGNDTTLEPGDTLLAIDGTPVGDLYARAAERISASTEGWRRHKAEMYLLAGPPAETRPDGPTESVRVRTAEGVISERRVRRVDPRTWYGIQPELPSLAAEIAPGIHYVDLNRLAWEDLEPHLETLAAARGIVFDLRGYPASAGSRILQHLTNETIHSAYWRVPTWIRPGLENAEYHESRWTLAPATPHLGGRIVFLTGPGAISYAESVMAIVEAYGLGEIVGERTAGTNGNINRVSIPGGFQMIWTGMRVVKHDGETVHQGVGVEPTVPTSRTVTGVAAGRDELIDRAIEVIQDGD